MLLFVTSPPLWLVDTHWHLPVDLLYIINILFWLLLGFALDIRSNNDVSNYPSRQFYIIAVPLLFILIFGFMTMKTYWGSDTIGTVFSRSDFKTSYYVNVSEEITHAKNYRLKADITVFSEGNQFSIGYIILDKIYFPNGGYITFKNTDYHVTTLETNAIILFTDDKGKEWNIELTNEKVE